MESCHANVAGLVPAATFETRVEQVKRVGNLRYELLKLWYDRRSITERHLDGNLAFHMPASEGNGDTCWVWCPHINCLTHDLVVRDAFERRQLAMLIWIRELSKVARPDASERWLQISDRELVLLGQAAQKHSARQCLVASGAKTGFAILDGELRSLLSDATTVRLRQLEDEIIQGRSHVVDALSESNPSPYGELDDRPTELVEGSVELTAIGERDRLGTDVLGDRYWSTSHKYLLEWRGAGSNLATAE